MSVYLDRKYILLVSSRLRNFKQRKQDVFNFSCPICGDSAIKTTKARGYITLSKKFAGYIYTCHNCSVSMGFAPFLKHVDSEKYKEYVMEKFQDKVPKKIVVVDLVKPVIDYRPTLSDLEIPSIDVLPETHQAREYIKHRLIPEKFWTEIFYAEDFRVFMDQTFPNHGKELYAGEPRIIFPFTDAKGMVTNIAGRSLIPNAKMRYISVKVTEDRKVFGMHRFNIREKVYMTEGQVDSFFLPNCLSPGDANLAGLDEWFYQTLGIQATLVFDRDVRNREIVSTINKAIENNHRVCLLPESFPGKDLNDAAMSGLTLKEIQSIVDSNTFEGLEARLKFASWKKC